MEEKKNKIGLWSKSGFLSFLNDSIQLRFYKKENFEQIGSMDLSPKSIYIFLSSIILILFILVFSLLAFTPLQRLIPRLSSIENTKKFIALNTALDDIESSLVSQELYYAAFQKMLTGEENVNFSELNIRQTSEERDKTHNENNREIIGLTVLHGSDSRSDGGMAKAKDIAGLIPSTDPNNIDIKIGSIFDEMEAVYFVPPVDGIISADFQPLKNHLGVDIIAPSNAPVKAISDGYIIIADWNMDTGHSIGIQHEHNILSFYKHNSVLLKEKGNFVKAGEIIAIIGNSGKLTNGPHLHFELWHSGKPINPNDYINLTK